MLARLGNYFTALTLLLCSAGLYQITVARYLQAPAVDGVVLPDPQPLKADGSLSGLFPKGAWQSGACKRLQTASGVLLFQDWKQVSDDEWELNPVTIVIGRGLSTEGDEIPIIMESTAGARIKFGQSLDLIGGGKPAIEYAHIRGEVTIRQAAPTDAAVRAGKPAGTSLDIRTSDVKIDKRNIWTTSPIRMQFGDSLLVGRDLTLSLATSLDKMSNATNLSAVLDRMELIYLDQLELPIASPPVAGSPPKSEKISVECGGSVEYDFALDELIMNDSVSLTHVIDGFATDRFDCAHLRAVLRDPMNTTLVRASPVDWIILVEASDTKANAIVEFQGLGIHAETISFDGVTGSLSAYGSSGVGIKYGSIEASLPNIAYRFDPAAPTILGHLTVTGAGKVMIDDPEIPLRLASWEKGISIQPKTKSDVEDFSSDVYLSVEGNLLANLVDGGTCQADKIHGWLKPAPRTTNADQDGLPQLRPDWLEAIGNVRVNTPAINAITNSLNLFFTHDEMTVVDSGADDGAQGMRQWVAQPSDDTPLKAPVARPRPIIRGQKVAAKLNMNKKGVVANDLSVTGDVEIQHHVQIGTDLMTVKLLGQELRMIDDAGNKILQLGSGVESPARLELGDGYFVGPKINVRLSDNFISIDDAGELRMPMSVLPASLVASTTDQDRSRTDVALPPKFIWKAAPLCRWTGGMTFDGNRVLLNDNVTISAAIEHDQQSWEVFLAGDQLVMTLKDRVSMSNTDEMRSAAIEEVALLQKGGEAVSIEALCRAQDGVLESRHLLHAPRLAVMPGDGGRVIGSGPGWYRLWTTAQANPVGGGKEPKNVDPNDSTVTAVHLVFLESMVASMSDKNLRFRRGVRVGSAAVDSWQRSIDVDKMATAAMDTGLLDCNELRIGIDPQSSLGGRTSVAADNWELEASGDVAFQFRSPKGHYEANASRAAYSSRQNLFIAEESPSRPGQLRRTTPDGQPGGGGTFKSITYNSLTHELDGDFYGGTPGPLPAVARPPSDDGGRF